MATRPTEERPGEYPRNVERERRHGAGPPSESDGATGPGTAGDGRDGGDGGMVRSEPAASRGGESASGVHRTPERSRPHRGDDGGDGRPHAATRAEAGPGESRERPHAGDGERLMRAPESDDLRRRWESIQASFIDAPREAVEEADRLVGELTDRIAERFRSERSGLETQWERGDEVSTEELRLTLQRYRGFFDRLLHL